MLRRKHCIGTVAYLGGLMSTPVPFNDSWSQMLIYTQEALCAPGEYIWPDRATYTYHDTARNELTQRMQGDWLMQFDADMAFDPDIVARLVLRMYQYDLDVVCGLYAYKLPPHYPVLYCWNGDTDKYEVVGDWDHSLDLIEAGSAGGGALLCRRRVFDRIRECLGEEPFTRSVSDVHGGLFGEDHSFFARLRKVGMKGYCAWKVQAGHIKYQEVSLPAGPYPAMVVPLGQYPMSGFGGGGNQPSSPMQEKGS